MLPCFLDFSKLLLSIFMFRLPATVKWYASGFADREAYGFLRLSMVPPMWMDVGFWDRQYRTWRISCVVYVRNCVMGWHRNNWFFCEEFCPKISFNLIADLAKIPIVCLKFCRCQSRIEFLQIISVKCRQICRFRVCDIECQFHTWLCSNAICHIALSGMYKIDGFTTACSEPIFHHQS